MHRDLDQFVAWLSSKEARLGLSDPDLAEVAWQVHPRFQFFKSLPWGANVLDIGAGNGGLAHWKSWLKPDRADLTLYGVDRDTGEFHELYAGWETVDLDRELPNFPGVTLNGFFASHLIEYLAAPETLIGWLGERAEPGARLYFEWTGPNSLDLPTREQLQKHGIEVMTSNFIDDWEHKQAPDLERMENWLADAGFNVMANGTIDLGILGEELFARAADRAVRSMGYWSLTRSSLYTVAVKSSEAVIPKRRITADAQPTRAPAISPSGAAQSEESPDLRLLRAKRALLTSGLFDAEFYRATYADMRMTTAEPLTHYLTKGEAEGRSPNPVFMPRYYRRRWMGTRPVDENALLHYIEEGEGGGAKPHPAFDPKAYLAANPPLAEFVDRPLFHYLAIGRDAGLPVAPGPRGAALARVLDAQSDAIEFEASDQRDDAASARYEEALVRELGATEGLALCNEVFGLQDDGQAQEKATAIAPSSPIQASPAVPANSRAATREELTRKREPLTSDAEQLEHWLRVSESIPGTTRGELARELARTSLSLPAGAIIVEIGAFMGSGTILLAGPRKARGSGKVHVVDPFDCAGDPHSTPIYERVFQAAGGGSLLDHFAENIRRAGVGDWIEVHQGRAPEIAAEWNTPADMIYIDLDVSGEAAGEAFDSWHNFLKPGGIIVVHNSERHEGGAGDTNTAIAIEARLRPPAFSESWVVAGNTFAVRAPKPA